jgi:hypothetical protein
LGGRGHLSGLHLSFFRDPDEVLADSSSASPRSGDFGDHEPQRIDDSITGHMDLIGHNTFSEKFLLCSLGQGEMISRYKVDNPAIHFLRNGTQEVVCALPGFDVPDGNVAVKTSDTGHKRRSGIPMDEDHVRFRRRKKFVDAL